MTWTTQPRSKVGGHPAITAGHGPNLLLLHGVGLRAEAWGAQLTLPACITAPDLLGHGESPPIGAPIDLSDYIEAAAEVLHALPGPVILAGHSMGAMIALSLAAEFPGKVAAVAALNPVFERPTDAAKAVQARADALDGRTPPDPAPTLHRWFGDTTTPERSACAAWLQAVNPASYKSAYTAFARSQIPDRATLAKIACPALFMTGSAEPNSTPAMSRAMADLAPKGRATIVEGAAHMMPMTNPAAVNAGLQTLLKAAA